MSSQEPSRFPFLRPGRADVAANSRAGSLIRVEALRTHRFPVDREVRTTNFCKGIRAVELSGNARSTSHNVPCVHEALPILLPWYLFLLFPIGKACASHFRKPGCACLRHLLEGSARKSPILVASPSRQPVLSWIRALIVVSIGPSRSTRMFLAQVSVSGRGVIVSSRAWVRASRFGSSSLSWNRRNRG